METNTSPLSHTRVDAADVLRGFAVLAIILLHSIEHFNFYSFPPTDTQSNLLNFTDKAIWDGLFFAFGGKAYAIFALLFGFSFFIQHDNQRMRGRDFRARFCWRLLLLFLIGQLNAAFFTGEILVMYSLVGFVLVAVCRLSDRKVMVLASLCLLQPVCLYQIARAMMSDSYMPLSLDTSSFWNATFQAQSSASFLETVKVNLWEGQLASLTWAWDHGRIFQTAGLFMFGMLAGRREWFHSRYLGGWGRVLAIALLVFFPLHGIEPMLSDYISSPALLKPLKIVVSSLANLSFMLILVSGVLFGYYRTATTGKLLSRLIPYGRMSMTNYVTQGIIGSAIYYHWGFHLQMGITGSILIGIAIFMIQYILCRIWLGHHKRGPLEHLWRMATWIETPSFLTRKPDAGVTA